jgi:hypothetical protein
VSDWVKDRRSGFPASCKMSPPHTQATDYGYRVRMNLEPGAGGGNWGKTALGGAAVCEIGFSDSGANAKDCQDGLLSHCCTSGRIHREINYYGVTVNGFGLRVAGTDLKPAINDETGDILIRSQNGDVDHRERPRSAERGHRAPGMAARCSCHGPRAADSLAIASLHLQRTCSGALQQRQRCLLWHALIFASRALPRPAA